MKALIAAVGLAFLLTACATTEHTTTVTPKAKPKPQAPSVITPAQKTSIVDKVWQLKQLIAGDEAKAIAVNAAIREQIKEVEPNIFDLYHISQATKLENELYDGCVGKFDLQEIRKPVTECAQEIGILGDKQHMQIVDKGYLQRLYNRCLGVHYSFVGKIAAYEKKLQPCINKFANAHGVKPVTLP